MGLSREKDIYICNTLKCRPPENRDPLPEEKKACRFYLDEQLRINPELIRLSKELGIEKNVKLLGYRTDIDRILNAVNIFCFPSHREGLPVSVMEAMASGLPVICGRIRGNTDLIDEDGGMLFDPHSVDACRKAIEAVLSKDKKRLGKHNVEKIQAMSVEEINSKMKTFYMEQ